MTDEDITTDLSSEVHRSVQPTAHSTSNWKVLGETDAADGVGVLGHNTAGTGETTGVAGVVDS